MARPTGTVRHRHWRARFGGLLSALVTGAIVLSLGVAAAQTDQDLDGVPDEDDNCPAIFNPDQEDHDTDEIGTTCDPDKGIPGSESFVMLYLRDQEGRPIEDACFRVTIVDEAGTNAERVCAVEPGYFIVSLEALAARHEIRQIAGPEGCSGGLAAALNPVFTPSGWQVVNVRYQCGVSFGDTFTKPGQEKPHAVAVAAKTKRVEVRLTWQNPRDIFDITAIQLYKGGRLIGQRIPAGAVKLRPRKLKVTRKRTSTSVLIGITKLRPGQLKFKVKAKKVSGRPTVWTRVVQKTS